jgi:hypothetical protein
MDGCTYYSGASSQSYRLIPAPALRCSKPAIAIFCSASLTGWLIRCLNWDYHHEKADVPV